MSKKIYGVPITTPLNPKKFGPGTVYVGTGEMPEGYTFQIDPEGEDLLVKTVNGIAPDGNGNVEIAGGLGDVNIDDSAVLTDSTWSSKKIVEEIGAVDESSAIVREASGEILTLSDSSNRELKGLTLYGKTTQNGTPTPEAPVELVSAGMSGAINTTVAGKNLLSLPYNLASGVTTAGVTFTYGDDGVIHAKGTATIQSNFWVRESNKWELPVGTYTISIKAKNAVLITGGESSDFPYAATNTRTFVVTEDTKKFGLFIVAVMSGVTIDEDIYVQVEAGAAATEWEPYKDQILTASTPNGLHGIPVSSGGNYTDENGQQWICDEIDFTRGVYVQRVGNYRMDTVPANIQPNAATMWTDTKVQFAAFNVVGSALSAINSSGDTGNVGLVSIGGYVVPLYAAASGAKMVGTLMYIGGDRAVFGDTAVTCKAYLQSLIDAGTPLCVIYRLQTPIETAMPAEELEAYAALHTNKPNTTVYNDAGAGLTVEYVAGTKTYIDQKLAEGAPIPKVVDTALNAGVINADGEMIVHKQNVTGNVVHNNGHFAVNVDSATSASGYYIVGSLDVTDIIRNAKSIYIKVDGCINELHLSISPTSWGTWAVKNLVIGNNDLSGIDWDKYTGKKIYLQCGSYGPANLPRTGNMWFTLRSNGTVIADRFEGQENYPTFADLDAPGNYITCWGDSLTAQAGWTSTLATLTGRTVYNAGTGGENARTIMARQGADVMMVNNITIPADTTAVQIATYSNPIKTAFGHNATPLLQGGAHVNPVNIGGVLGTLKWTGSSYNDTSGTWTFTRLAAGEAVTINRPTAMTTAFDREKNNPHLMVIFMGQNGGYNNTDELVNLHRLMVSHAKAKHTIMLGLTSGTADSRGAYETAMTNAFGRYFINLREYLSKYGLADAGLTPTDADTSAMAIGQVPPQLLADTVHYTSACKTVIGNMIYKKCCELGIF